MEFVANNIDKTKLPTNRQVIEYLLYLKKNGTSSVGKNLKLSSYIHILVNVLCELWNITNIPILVNSTIRKLLERLLEKYYQINKKHNKYVVGEWDKLFKISKCKCEIEMVGECTCPEGNKISTNIKTFFFGSVWSTDIKFGPTPRQRQRLRYGRHGI